MGILSRCKDILSANINAFLDNLDDKNADKLIDEKLRQAREDLADVKKETAAVMANESAAKRRLDEATAEVGKYANAAMNAVKQGKDDDARKLLETKQRKESVIPGLQENYNQAHADAENMRAMYSKLQGDIELLEARADMIKGKVATAKARETVNKMTSGRKVGASLADFDRLEQKADKRLDTANAMSELDAGASAGEDLLAQYGGGAASSSVEDELAKLKAQLSGGSQG